jgi:hypothetical protein
LDLAGLLEEERKRADSIQQQADRREKRFAQKEVEFRKGLRRYDDLLRELSVADGNIGELAAKNFERIDLMHRQIQTGLNEFQEKRVEEMQKHEEEIIQQFSERLKESEGKATHDTGYILKHLGTSGEDSRLGSQLELMKAAAEVIERKNTELEIANRELRMKCSLLQEEARMLVAKNCLLKGKGTPRLGDKLIKTFKTLPKLESRSPMTDRPLFRLPDEKILTRQERLIAKLQKKLEIERTRLSAARSSFSRELEIKQELRALLKQCCEEVHSEIMQRTEGKDSSEVKQAVIKALDAQIRMLTLIYDRAFQSTEAFHQAELSY